MAREKANLQWIANDATRRSTFKKRINTLTKKAGELNTLCGVKVSVVAYGEDGAAPEVYPSVPEATKLLTSFKAMPDDLENLKKVTNQEDYLRSRISKLQDQKKRSEMEQHEDHTSDLLHAAMARQGPGLSSLTMEELLSLKCMVERRMSNAKARYQQIVGHELLEKPVVPPPQEQPTITPQLQAPYTNTEMQTLPHVEEPQPEQQDWLMDYFSLDEVDGISPMVNNDAGYNNGGAGPSNNSGAGPSSNGGAGPSTNGGAGPSTSGADILQYDNTEDFEFPWPLDPFPDME